jgi:hypothetical protein
VSGAFFDIPRANRKSGRHQYHKKLATFATTPASLAGKSQILAAALGLKDFRAFHHRLQAAADGFDFGQFRHASFTLRP